MDEQENKPQRRTVTFRLCLHAAAIGYALYMFYSILHRYLQGGESAPNLATVIIGAIVLIGGSILLGVLSWRLYQSSKSE